MTSLQKLKKANHHFEFCNNCLCWFDCRNLDQVIPHFACGEYGGRSSPGVPQLQWTQSLSKHTGEIYSNPHPLTNPLLRRELNKSLLRTINLNVKRRS
jgi:hypothetical protein